MRSNIDSARITDHPSRPYMSLVTFPVTPGFRDEIENLGPGADKISFNTFEIPRELLPEARRLLKAHHHTVTDAREKRKRNVGVVHKDAYPHQLSGANFLLSNRGGYLAHEPGLGKTLAMILALKAAGCKRILVVCPAIVRSVWGEQLQLWWKKHPEFLAVKTGKMAKSKQAPFMATSYELLGHFEHTKGWDAIVFDESHYIGNPKPWKKSLRSKRARKLLDNNRGAFIIGATGTPITNEPIGLFDQLDHFWPGRVGTHHEFAHWYCIIDSNDWTDYWVHGVNEHNAPALSNRLRGMMHRFTKQEAIEAGYMPPFVCTPIRVKPKRGFKARETFHDLIRMDFHNTKECDALARACGSQKVQAAADFALQAAGAGSKVAVAAYHHATVHEIYATIEKRNKKMPVWRFTGADSQEMREYLIQTALKSDEPGILVFSMASAREGINTIAQFDELLCAEIYPTPGMMVQFLNRAHRMDNVCNVRILWLEGTYEEITAMRLCERIENSGKLLKTAASEQAIKKALNKAEKISEKDEFKRLRAAAANRIEEDEYV